MHLNETHTNMTPARSHTHTDTLTHSASCTFSQTKAKKNEKAK